MELWMSKKPFCFSISANSFLSRYTYIPLYIHVLQGISLICLMIPAINHIFIRRPASARSSTDRDRTTLGDPNILKKSDFNEINIRDSFVLLSLNGVQDYIWRELIREIIIIRNQDNLETSSKSYCKQHFLHRVMTHGCCSGSWDAVPCSQPALPEFSFSF